MASGMIHQAQPIFIDGEVSPDCYCVFFKEFETERTDGAEVEIAADSTFELFINDRPVPIQQLADFPDHRTWSHAEISEWLRPGRNTIRCGVHFIGENFLTYQQGTPYLQMVVRRGDSLLAKTDESWRCAFDNAYKQGMRCRVSNQLGFVFEYRADAPETFCDRRVRIAPVAGELCRRTVPQLVQLPPVEGEIRTCGVLRREREGSTFAHSCMSDFCAPLRVAELFSEFDAGQMPERYPCRKFRFAPGKRFVFKPLAEFPGANGYFVIVDLGRETVGYLNFELDAPAGTVIDVTFGEHLDDGRVRSWVGLRNFGDRYRCREGRNRFTAFHRRYGCRYLELHITNVAGGVVALHHAGVIPLELPLPREAEFRCEDSMIPAHNRLAAATLKLCMHEHYEDCPWREQALYGYDSRNQMLYGYYVWGNYRFAEASLDLLGRSYDGKRYLALTAPGKSKRAIPIFTMAWISALGEHMLYSGRTELFRKYRDEVDAILDRALSEPVPGHEDIYSSGSGDSIWNFYEWRGELSHLDVHPQSPCNLYLAEALRAAARMHRFAGDPERGEFLDGRADAVILAVRKLFFDPRRGGLRVSLEDGGEKLYEHPQALLLALADLPQDELAAVLENLENRSMHAVTLSAFHYLLRGLRRAGERGRAMLMPRLRAEFDPMLLSGATSLWETSAGGDDFDYAGSLCHGWSGVFPYFCGSILLGVEPLEPGFASFTVDPVCCGLSRASGEVPTPSGAIRVSWRREPSGALRVEVVKPAGLKFVPGGDALYTVSEK